MRWQAMIEEGKKAKGRPRKKKKILACKGIDLFITCQNARKGMPEANILAFLCSSVEKACQEC
jgi:hypothetical protein